MGHRPGRRATPTTAARVIDGSCRGAIDGPSGRCFAGQTQDLTVAGATTLDFQLPQRSDSFGYFCQDTAFVRIGMTLFSNQALPQSFATAMAKASPLRVIVGSVWMIVPSAFRRTPENM